MKKIMDYIYSFLFIDEIKNVNISKTNEWSNPEMQSIGNDWFVQSKL